MEPTLKVAQKFPDVKFEHATGYKTADNVTTYNAKFHEGRYVIGQIAAKMSKTGTAGYIVSFPIPEVVAGINAFMLGAQSVNPDFKTDRSKWGRVPRTEIPLPTSFSANETERKQQDIGFDGLNDDQEKDFYKDYLAKTSGLTGYDEILKDPSSDDFKYYGDPSFPAGTSVLERYSQFNGPEGNSQTNTGSAGVQSGTNLPDAEDVNRDNSFEENEAYFEYRIPFVADPTGTGIDIRNLKFHVEFLEDKGTGRRWHHFRVPIDGYDKKYGEINDFRSIRFMRTIVKDPSRPP